MKWKKDCLNERGLVDERLGSDWCCQPEMCLTRKNAYPLQNFIVGGLSALYVAIFPPSLSSCVCLSFSFSSVPTTLAGILCTRSQFYPLLTESDSIYKQPPLPIPYFSIIYNILWSDKVLYRIWVVYYSSHILSWSFIIHLGANPLLQLSFPSHMSCHMIQ